MMHLQDESAKKTHIYVYFMSYRTETGAYGNASVEVVGVITNMQQVSSIQAKLAQAVNCKVTIIHFQLLRKEWR